MPEYSPLSEATLHLSEEGFQLALKAYQQARPEEFRVVSTHYPDGDPAITPLSMNDDGEWLDYALRIKNLAVDMAPANPALQSPVPPATGQFQITAQIATEFRNFSDPTAIFSFPIDLWIRCRPLMMTENGKVFIAIELKDADLRIKGIGPTELAGYIEYIMTLVVRHALDRLRLPTTYNLEDILEILMLGLDVKQDTVQLYAAIHRPDEIG